MPVNGRRSTTGPSARRPLTPRPSGAPTAGHRARSGGTRCIFASPGLASSLLILSVKRRPSAFGASTRQHRAAAQGRECPFAGAGSPLQTRHSRDSLKSDGKSAAKYWILDSRDRFPISQIEKGYGLRRNPLILLAPRPGLEPGTYGLTVGRSDRAAGRANAHFRGSGLPILSMSFASISTGLEPRTTTGYWKRIRPRLLGCSAVLSGSLRDSVAVAAAQAALADVTTPSPLGAQIAGRSASAFGRRIRPREQPLWGRKRSLHEVDNRPTSHDSVGAHCRSPTRLPVNDDAPARARSLPRQAQECGSARQARSTMPSTVMAWPDRVRAADEHRNKARAAASSTVEPRGVERLLRTR